MNRVNYSSKQKAISKVSNKSTSVPDKAVVQAGLNRSVVGESGNYRYFLNKSAKTSRKKKNGQRIMGRTFQRTMSELSAII
jgi:hypothetical protein